MKLHHLLPVCALASLPLAAQSSLEEDFRNPPVNTRPYVWWHWLGSNFSKEGITKDLEAMKATGIGGATIFNISSSVTESHAPTLNNPWPDQTYRSPKYWEAMKHAAAEAKRLGLEIGLHNTVGYSTTGGPWIDEERSMQRLVWSETDARGGAEVRVQLAAPQFTADEGWGKAGRKISWFRDFAVQAVPAGKKEIQPEEVIDLTGKMSADGQLIWNAPAGDWKIYRLAHASTGRPPHPVPDDVLGKTLEADKMSLEQTRHHWESVIRPIQQHLGPLLGSSFKHFLIDSYEAGNQNWTPAFREEFRKRKGYDPLPWIMTFNGTVRNGTGEAERIIGDATRSARFEWDYRDVISSLFYDNGWKPAREMIHAAGATLQHEAYGGQFDTIAGSALADLPMMEFWTGKIGDGNANIIGAARAAGRKVIGAEAFTGSPGQSKWTETPALLKSCGDAIYAGGVNRMILHHWVHQPYDDRYKPGFGMGWWGTHFNRHQTWFEPGKDFFRYMGRVQALLQRGETPSHHVSVGSSANKGDAISLAAFLKDVVVKDGRIVLPSGRSYRFIHVPHNGAMLPETAKRIEELLLAGATIVSGKPRNSPSLANYPECDNEVAAIATRVWGDSKESTRKVGKGTLFTRGDVTAATRELALPVAFSFKQQVQDVRVLHRAEGKADWFFVANVGGQSRSFTLSFAVTGRQPELWNAETGNIGEAVAGRTADGRTEVDLSLQAAKSVFVMFRKPSTGDALTAVEAPAGWSLASSAKDGAWIESSTPLAGTLRFASGKTRAFDLQPAAPIAVAGTWSVAFKPILGAPFNESFPSLVSFHQSENPDIRYFSGTATYTLNVDVPAASLKDGRRMDLNLGEVRDMATVSVNGKPQGVLWNPPFIRDINDALKPGRNVLEISVTNTWHNLLAGDEQYPADFEWGADRGGNGRMMKGYPDWFVKNQPRPEKGRKAFVVWYYHRKDSKLLPAGLIGPVVLTAKDSIAIAPAKP